MAHTIVMIAALPPPLSPAPPPRPLVSLTEQWRVDSDLLVFSFTIFSNTASFFKIFSSESDSAGFTGKDLLDLLSRDELEGNLTTIFS